MKRKKIKKVVEEVINDKLASVMSGSGARSLFSDGRAAEKNFQQFPRPSIEIPGDDSAFDDDYEPEPKGDYESNRYFLSGP